MILRLRPHLSERIWGGKKLQSMKKISVAELSNHTLPLGETWEVSTHHEGTSFDKESNRPLSDFVKLKYLIKFLDTSDVLSIQVHPDDEYALKHENDLGKNESWLILDALPGAGIYLGLKEGVTKKNLKDGLINGEDISRLLNFYPVKAGDFFYIPAGTIHAISKDITLIEVQQSSGITYRVWDWNRVDSKGKSRELHLEKSLDVINDSPLKNSLDFFSYQENVFGELKKEIVLLDNKYFYFSLINLKKSEEVKINIESSTAIVILEGELMIGNNLFYAFESACIINESEISISAKTKARFVLVK